MLETLKFLQQRSLFDFLKFIYVFIFGCAGSLLLSGLFASCGEWGLLFSCSVWASQWSGFSCCRAWVLECIGFRSCCSWAQYLRHIDLAASWHVGSSQTRDWTGVPCTARFLTTGQPGKPLKGWLLLSFPVAEGTLSWKDEVPGTSEISFRWSWPYSLPWRGESPISNLRLRITGLRDLRTLGVLMGKDSPGKCGPIWLLSRKGLPCSGA